jgi:hypothetical protein
MNTVERGHCRECRASLTASVVPATPPPVTEKRVRICPRCRRGNPEDAEACFDCGGRFAITFTQPPVPVAPDPRPCPGCGTEMEPGMVFLDQGTLWQQLLTDRHAWMPLAFRRDESLRNERVVQPGEKVHAQRCPACNSVWIAPPPPR